MNAYENICFVSEKPIYLKIKETPQKGIFHLHDKNKMAIEFKDGYGLFALNGIIVTKEIVMTPANKLDANLILKERNVEIRREIVRKIGIERVCQQLHTESLDKWNNYELLSLPIPDMNIKAVYLKMKNPSIGTYHLEGVPPKIKTCRQALAWRDGEENYIEPLQLT
jgi:hypothetical protein